jgi:hypothetical protein
MDRISAALLEEFSKSFDLTGLKQPDQFEHFASYLPEHAFLNAAPSNVA